MGLAGLTREALSRKPWGASDDVFSSSQGVWQKLQGQREGEGGGPLLSCQGRPKSKGQQTNNYRADQQSKQARQDTALATGEPDACLPLGTNKAGAGKRDTHT